MNPLRRMALVTLAACLPLAAIAQTQPAAGSCAAKGNAPMKVKITTSMGPFVIELNKEKAPVSVENFVKYVESGHYNGTIFHRVIDGFMVQGGGFNKDMSQKPTQAPIKNEGANGLKNENYTVAMARTGVRDSATSQFFINVKDNEFLNYTGENPQGWGYAVFGKVVEGKDVVDKIKKVATGTTGGHQNVPSQAVTIEKAECV
ncbi:MAG: peptidyl-prolyl cis-trans isomerase [Cytophagaceae bacterium]|nr:peptidyl-prolyl cis-trans isomerase [Gemmatimonadaceae bacterium]